MDTSQSHPAANYIIQLSKWGFFKPQKPRDINLPTCTRNQGVRSTFNRLKSSPYTYKLLEKDHISITPILQRVRWHSNV